MARRRAKQEPRADGDMLCPSLLKAALNRARVAADIEGDYYREQAHKVAQWGLGERPPEGIVLGELPYVGKLNLRREVSDGV